jgi:ribA/ribD-fused uncharacterized protein
MGKTEQTVSQDIFITYFSAYSAHAIEYEGTRYPTVEHAYHCQRYGDQKIVREILESSSPLKAWRVSQKYKHLQSAEFPERKVGIMSELCRAKVRQHDDVRRALAETGKKMIVKHITTGPKADGFWDDGTDGKGKNVSGKIWTEIRESLSPKTLI